MPGVTLKIDTADLDKTIGAIIAKLQDRKTPLRQIGALAKESIRTNFVRGGRPASWPKLKTRQGQPLRDTNRLMNSITSTVKGDLVVIGTNVVYAALQNFGARKHSFGSFTFAIPAHKVKAYTRASNGKVVTVKAHRVRKHNRTMSLPWGNIPARPFMLLQNDDIGAFEDIIAKFIMEGA